MADPKDLVSIDKAIEYLKTQADVYGVGAVKVNDGECFYFSIEKLQSLIENAKTKGTNRVFIFVKAGSQPILN